jgi:hypothetical protein
MQGPYAAEMTDPNPATAATRVAIEFLTLWLEQDRQFAAEHIFEVVNDPDGPGTVQAIVGLLNLSMIIELQLAKANGATDYLAWAGDHLRSMSPDLPE